MQLHVDTQEALVSEAVHCRRGQYSLRVKFNGDAGGAVSLRTLERGLPNGPSETLADYDEFGDDDDPNAVTNITTNVRRTVKLEDCWVVVDVESHSGTGGIDVWLSPLDGDAGITELTPAITPS